MPKTQTQSEIPQVPLSITQMRVPIKYLEGGKISCDTNQGTVINKKAIKLKKDFSELEKIAEDLKNKNDKNLQWAVARKQPFFLMQILTNNIKTEKNGEDK